MINYGQLLNFICIHMLQVRGAQISPISKKDISFAATKIFLLEVLLFRFRAKNTFPFEDYENKKDLHHLLFSKFNIPFSEIKKLELADILLILKDDLENLYNELSNDSSINFNDIITHQHDYQSRIELQDQDWNPIENRLLIETELNQNN